LKLINYFNKHVFKKSAKDIEVDRVQLEKIQSKITIKSKNYVLKNNFEVIVSIYVILSFKIIRSLQINSKFKIELKKYWFDFHTY
jgi:hypothetical protein